MALNNIDAVQQKNACPPELGDATMSHSTSAPRLLPPPALMSLMTQTADVEKEIDWS